MAKRKTSVIYRFFSAKGDLLYLGVTSDPGARLGQHAKTKPWWTEVSTATFDHVDSYEDALAVEAAAIVAETPRYNAVGVPGNPHERNGVNAATRMAIHNAKVRRFQRYLKEMRADGLDITVTRREADGVFAAVPEYASPSSH